MNDDERVGIELTDREFAMIYGALKLAQRLCYEKGEVEEAVRIHELCVRISTVRDRK